MIEQKDLDRLGTMIEEMGRTVKTQVDEVKEGFRTDQESRKEFAKRVADIETAITDLRKKLPPDGAVLAFEGEAATRSGGLFAKGEPMLDYPDLLQLNRNANVLRGTDAELTSDLQDANDAVAMQICMRTARYKGNVQLAIQDASRTKDWKRWQRVCKTAGYPVWDVGKTTMLYPESGGEGANLTTTTLSSQLFEYVSLALRVSNNFPSVRLGNHAEKFPIVRSDGIGVRGGAATTDPPPRADLTAGTYGPWPSNDHFTTPTFGQVSFDVKDILAYMWFSDHMIQDSFIPFLPFMREQIGLCIARARDRACMSGDIQGIVQGAHMDDYADAYTVQDARTLWNGLRRVAANYMIDGSAAAYGYDEFKKQTKAIDKFGMTRSNVVLWLAVGAMYDLMADSAFQKVNEFGPQAVVRTGQLGAVEGVAVIPTEWIPTDMASTGYSGNAGVLTAAVMADTSRFLLGSMGGVSVELTRVAPMLANIIQASTREDFVPMEAIDANKIFAASGTVPVSVMRNLTK